MENKPIICANCSYDHFCASVKLIATNRPNPRPWDAKYIPQIQLRCANCNKFQKIMTQTPELISEINEELTPQRFLLLDSTVNAPGAVEEPYSSAGEPWKPFPKKNQ